MKIKGKECPLSFDINALSELSTAHGVNVLQWDQSKLGPEHIRALAYVGLTHGARRAGEKFTLSIEEVGDELNINSISEVMKAMSDQNLTNAKEGNPAGESPGTT